MNPTIVGLFAVIVWGVSLPLVRVVEPEIGLAAYIGTVFASCGILGLLALRLQRKPFPSREVFKNPYLYGRWAFFVLHEACIISAVSIVQIQHVPFVILLNYLWPTAIILCSVLIAGVSITRWWAFLLGSAIVIASMAIEVVGLEGLSASLFQNKMDVIAYALAFVGAISWGLYCAISRRAGDETGSGSVVPLFQLTLGLALPLSFLPGMATWGDLTLNSSLILTGYCLAQFVAYLSWDYGMRKGSIIALSLCADFIPWLSLFTAFLLLDIEIHGKTMFSAALLVIGAMITRYGTLTPRKVAEPAPHSID